MEVILLGDVDKLGGEGSVVRVADGYARNYLIPRKLALPSTPATRKILEQVQEKRKREEKKLLDASRSLAAEVSRLSLTIPMAAGEEDRLFGSVTSQDIAEAARREGVEIDKRKILLEEPIRELGVFTVDVRLHSEVAASLKVWVVRE